MPEYKEVNEKAPRRRGRKGKNQQKEIKNSQHEENPTLESSSSATNSGYHDTTFKPHHTLLINLTEDTPTWHECGRNNQYRNDTISSLKQNGNTKNMKSNPSHIVSKYRSLADQTYQQEISIFRSSSNYDKDEQWVENTMKRGTLKDRIAAMSVVVSSNPVHKLYALDMLLNLAGVATGNNTHTGQTNDRVSHMASEALTDLFTNTLLPSNRKLIGFQSRPLYLFENNQKLSISPRILLLWRYEEMLKNRYSAFITQYLGRTLAQSGTSSLDLSKVNALRTVCSLLKEIPEGEQILLSLAVNKIGDPSKKIAAAAGHELRRLLEAHPMMTNIIAREVQQLAHRPNLSTRALYSCIIFLNQLKLVKVEDDDIKEEEDVNKAKHASTDRSSLPASLINTYFQIFEVAVNKSKAVEKKNSKAKKTSQTDLAMKSRLLGALLTGVNRAHPYLPTKDTGMEEHVDSLYRIAHVSPPSACTQALMLLFHLAVGSSSESISRPENTLKNEGGKVITSRKDRFYRALYSKVSDTNMFVGRQLTLFFNLIYKAMKYDDNSLRIVAFAKRLLHTAYHQNPSVVSGTLFLLSEVTKNQPVLQTSIFTIEGHSIDFDPLKREPSAAFSVVEASDEAKNEETNISIGASTIWEVALTSHHYHPTVKKFASTMGDITYNGDPLRDFGLAPFLDKFAFRNPKSSKKIDEKFRRGESIGERRSGLQGGLHALSSLPVNDPEFWQEGKSVTETEEFFKTFFVERAKRDGAKGIERGKNKNETQALEDGEVDAENENVDFDWESDEEEEAFVQKLAENLIESHNSGKANFDDEDPDMDDWSDYEGSDDEGENENDEENVSESELNQFILSNASNLDEILDVSEDSDDNEIEEDQYPFSKEELAADDEDEVLSDEEFDNVDGGVESDEEDDELAISFGNEDPSSEEDEGKQVSETKSSKKENKNKRIKSSFADASEYEELIEKSLDERSDRKRSSSVESVEKESEHVAQSHKKKRRRRSRAKK